MGAGRPTASYPGPVVTTRQSDAQALVRWAIQRGAEVRPGRRGWVLSIGGRQIAVVHKSPGPNGLRHARADVERPLRKESEPA